MSESRKSSISQRWKLKEIYNIVVYSQRQPVFGLQQQTFELSSSHWTKRECSAPWHWLRGIPCLTAGRTNNEGWNSRKQIGTGQLRTCCYIHHHPSTSSIAHYKHTYLARVKRHERRVKVSIQAAWILSTCLHRLLWLPALQVKQLFYRSLCRIHLFYPFIHIATCATD